MSLLLICYWIWGIASVCAITQGILLSLHTWEHRRFARRRLTNPTKCDQSRRVALLAPCKGLDVELEQNLLPLLNQEYANYEAIFIVESEDDPALPIIRRVIAGQSRVPARVVIAGKAFETGQKIHNLSVALSWVSDTVEILAFVDSDIRPAADWLERLVSRLYRQETGAVTGYRWFVPTESTVANHILYSINASIAALLGSGRQHIAWGGSWAIRRHDFERIGVREYWHGTISDDLVATQRLHAARLSIDYEPACMTASPMNYSRWGLVSFLRRQHLIGRIYAPGVWFQTFLCLVLSTVAVLGAIVLTVQGLLAGHRETLIPASVLGLWYALQVYRGVLRSQLARMYVRDWSVQAERAAWFDIWASPITMLLNTFVMAGACVGSRLVWRGITYDLDIQGRLLRVKQPATQTLPADRILRFDPPESLGPTSRQQDPIRSSHMPGQDR